MTTTQRRALDDALTAPSAPVVLPGDPAYDAARRVGNAAVDRPPRVVVRCRSVACDDGVVLDLGGLDEVTVDPRHGRVRAAYDGETWTRLATPAP